jgi:hypothetical protein
MSEDTQKPEGQTQVFLTPTQPEPSPEFVTVQRKIIEEAAYKLHKAGYAILTYDLLSAL